MLYRPFAGRGENCVRPSRLPPEVERKPDAAEAGSESRSVFHIAYPTSTFRQKGAVAEPTPEGTSTSGRGLWYLGTVRLIMSAYGSRLLESYIPRPRFNCSGIRRLARRLPSRLRGRFARHLNLPP